jgi:hypothetical protein
MKKALVSLGNVFLGLNDKFDNACLSLERKVCNGSTIDESLDVLDGKVIDVTVKACKPVKKISFKKLLPKVKASAKVEKEVVSPAVPTPFTKCTSTPVVVKRPKLRMKAIPLTQYCPFCREVIPTEAHFCPHCAGQIIIPMAKCGPAPITACKIKGITPHKIHTAINNKPSLTSRIKSVLHMETPFAKPRKSIVNM